MPSVDFSDMESGQSEIRNKILVPVFKRLGIIEQWGNGLKLIATELQSYPEIELSWKEPGIAFRITFTNKNYKQQQEFEKELNTIIHQVGTRLALSRHQVGTRLAPGWHQVKQILEFCKEPQPVQKVMELTNWKDRTKFRNKYIKLFMEFELLGMMIPDKPQSSRQKYQTTQKGNTFLKLLGK